MIVNEPWKLECEGWKYLYQQDRRNKMLPTSSGIYCFILTDINGYCRIMYVGKSSNFSSRLKIPHPIESHWDQIFLCYILETDNQDQLEIDFIKRYRPELNKQHNGQKVY